MQAHGCIRARLYWIVEGQQLNRKVLRTDGRGRSRGSRNRGHQESAEKQGALT
jgi:hypothetical protein